MVHNLWYDIRGNKNERKIVCMSHTWKVVYFLPSAQWTGGNIRGVAFVEAATQPEASFAFKQLYAGQYSTIDRIEKFC